MADKIKPLTTSLSQICTLLERREKAALDVAGRALLPLFKEASLDEAAFFTGLRLLVGELALARSHITGDVNQPMQLSDLAARLPPGGMNQLLTEMQGLLGTEHLPAMTG